MQAQIVNKMPEDKTFGVNAFNQCCEQISLLVKKVNSCKITAIEVEAKSDASGLYNSVAYVQGLDVTMPDNLPKRCEQLKLYAACLEDIKKRTIYVRLSDFTSVLVKSGPIFLLCVLFFYYLFIYQFDFLIRIITYWLWSM